MNNKKKLRNFCFTNFELNYDYNKLIDIWKYLIFGEEICPNTSKIHHQGYCELKKQTAFNTIKKLCKWFHLEERKGNQKQAIEYCKKDNKFTEFGDKNEQGWRNDLLWLKEWIKNGEWITNIMDEYTELYLKYNRGIKEMVIYNETKRNFKTELYFIVGKPGCGKWKFIHDLYGEKAYWMMKPNGNSVFFDGYDNNKHEVLVLDDFYSWIPYDLLLRLADYYPLNVQIKGGATNFLCKKIYITWNIENFEEFYTNIFDKQALIRRITWYTNMSSKTVLVPYYDWKYKLVPKVEG